mgnify:CR=1 FL=1
MSTINEYAIQSELAQAAYGTFSKGLIPVGGLIGDDAGMSNFQADEFTKNWQVADQYTDPATGLSATVFEAMGAGLKEMLPRLVWVALRAPPMPRHPLISDAY